MTATWERGVLDKTMVMVGSPPLLPMRWGSAVCGPPLLPLDRQGAFPPQAFPTARYMALRGGGSDDWLPPAFSRLPLATRWLIAFQSILFLFGHIVPSHPVLGAAGGAIRSLGLQPVFYV